MIVEKIEVGPLATNCYIVGSGPGRDGMIIDPGGEAKRILKKVSDLKLDIKLVVLTHGHIDHVGALGEVKEASGADIAAHADDVKTLGDGSLSVLLGISPSALPPPDRLLEDGDKIDIGNLNFIVRHTPGHSPDSICLLGEGVVFSGDTLFNYGIGRADLPGGNPSQLMDSIRTKLMVLADNMVVYPGHGPKTTIGAERRGNPFLQD
jgi:glyoxylase-like metal-dependent hydrolase (beta-lactamase superfamily II)